jgi:hypothetical protein
MKKGKQTFADAYDKWVDAHRPTLLHPEKSWPKYIALKTGTFAVRGSGKLIAATIRGTYNALTPEQLPDAGIERTAELYDALAETPEIDVDAVVARLLEHIPNPLSTYRSILTEVLRPDLTPPELPRFDEPIAHAQWRDRTRRYLNTFYNGTLEETAAPILNAIEIVAKNLPPPSKSALRIPIIDLIPEPAKLIEEIILGFYRHDILERGHYEQLRKRLDTNATDDKGNIILPTKSKVPGEELSRHYLHGTPLLTLLTARVPFAIPTEIYKEHGFLFAKSGHGKSQSLRALFTSLLTEDCALFLIDGNGHLIENIDKVAALRERLIILDPEDIPALNFFKLQGGSREKQMELFFYLFKAIEQGLTERQATMVAYLVDFMHAIPNSTLDTLREVCDAKDLPYAEYLKLTPQITQDFFKNQFLGSDQLVRQTKSQIATRLYSLCRNHAFIAMFNAPQNKFDAFRAMQEKKIVIINTDRNKLGDHGSAVFGRFILAQCLAAAFQRPKHQRHLALIICDEAKAYLDDQSQKILSDARAYGLGLLLATQHPDQLADGVRKEVINNTSVKFAGPAAASVVAQLNRDMRCEADFILGMKKKDFSHADWACYVDNVTARAIRLRVPFGTVEKLPTLSATEYAELRRANKAAYASDSTTKPPPPGGPDGPTDFGDRY